MNIALSIIVVNWNTRDVLRECLDSLYSKPCAASFEVFVVDNASSDGSADMVAREFVRAKLIANSKNIGYAGANNQGMRLSAGRRILLLNSDVVVNPDVLMDTLHSIESDERIGILGCRLVGADGETQPSYSPRFICGRDIEQQSPGAELGLIDCAYVWGAYMLVKREVIDSIGLLDENFFVYYEDIDWCWRAHEAGWRVVYDTKHSVLHHCGASSDQLSRTSFHGMFFESERALCRKHLSSAEIAEFKRMRTLHHVRRIVRYWIAGKIRPSKDAADKLAYHIAGLRSLRMLRPS